MINTTTLDNGARIVTEVVDGVYSASIGVFIDVGSEDETESNNGVSHCLEHMLFKGTKTRTAEQISVEIEDAGGSLGAATGKENTCFYGRTMGSELPVAIDLLLDMLVNANLTEEDLDLEKQVIVEEIKMYEDDPEDLAMETLLLKIWPGHPLSRPITGTEETVLALNSSVVKSHVTQFYTPEKIVVSIAGLFNETVAIESIKSRLQDLKPGTQEKISVPPNIVSFSEIIDKDVEQAHVTLATNGVSITDDRRYQIAVLDLCLGGSVSSRLFQEVRERRGLVYTINTFRESHRVNGLLGVYAACSPKNVAQVLDLVSTEIQRVKNDGFTDREIARAKVQLKSDLLLGLESMRSRSMRNAYGLLFYGGPLSIEGITEDIDKVTGDEVRKLAKDLLSSGEHGLVVVGPQSQLKPSYSVSF